MTSRKWRVVSRMTLMFYKGGGVNLFLVCSGGADKKMMSESGSERKVTSSLAGN